MINLSKEESELAVACKLTIEISEGSLALSATVAGRKLQQKWEGVYFEPDDPNFPMGEASEFLTFVKFWRDVLCYEEHKPTYSVQYDGIEIACHKGVAVEVHALVDDTTDGDTVAESFPAETLEYLGFRFPHGNGGSYGDPRFSSSEPYASWDIEPYTIAWEIPSSEDEGIKALQNALDRFKSMTDAREFMCSDDEFDTIRMFEQMIEGRKEGWKRKT